MSQWMSMELPEVTALRRESEMTVLHLRKVYTQLMNTRRHAYMASAMERCRAVGKPPRGLVEFHGQFGEDCVLYELFEGKQDGFFIEAGAFNGVDFSVSYAFEQLGWNGLLVEALPNRAEECRQRRPHSRVVHAALGPPNAGPTATFSSTNDFYGGMLSRRTPTGTGAPAVPEAPSQEITVPLVTLDTLLESHTGPIDFVSLDLEGGEPEALQGFSLARFRPRVMLIEDNGLGQRSPLVQFMSTQPYTLAGWNEINALYIRSDEKALLERHAKMAVFGI
ncbi:MAG: FkbM family methyltransferase [Phycisphaerae bacterium]|nr:FkbM family methyltransferase [Phycisphaerae bacterium]